MTRALLDLSERRLLSRCPSSGHENGRARLFGGRPCDLPGCAESTNPSVSFAHRFSILIERSHFHPIAGRTKTERIVVRDGRVRRFRFSLATPPAAQLRRWLVDAGFSRVEAYGAHGEPLRVDSRRLVVVAER